VATKGIEQALKGRARRLALKGPVSAVKLTPGRDEVETL
jgi:hypothetical protein